MGEIQRANPVARRRAVLIVVTGLLLGGLAVFAFEFYRPLLEQWLLSDPEQLAQRLAAVVIFMVLITTVPLLAFAIYLWILGTRVRRQQRSPLQDELLVRDTPILRGDAAEIRGQVLQCLAVGLALLACGLAVAWWRLATIASTHAA